MRAPLRKAIPWLMLYEVARASKSHWDSVDPGDRKRLTELLRKSKGKPQNLSAGERAELAALVSKANPRLFLGLVANKLSPVPLPPRVVRGRR